MAALGFEVMFGSLTITGSFMAFGKLQEIVKGAPITYRFQNPINISLFFVTLGMFAYLIFQPANQHVFYARSEEHTSELQSRLHLVCRLLLEKKKKKQTPTRTTSNATTIALLT